MVFLLESTGLANAICLINVKMKFEVSAGVREQSFPSYGKHFLPFPLLWRNTVIFCTGNYINLGYVENISSCRVDLALG